MDTTRLMTYAVLGIFIVVFIYVTVQLVLGWFELHKIRKLSAKLRKKEDER